LQLKELLLLDEYVCVAQMGSIRYSYQSTKMFSQFVAVTTVINTCYTYASRARIPLEFNLTLAVYLTLALNIIPYAMMTRTTITLSKSKMAKWKGAMGWGKGNGNGYGKGRHEAITSGRVPCF